MNAFNGVKIIESSLINEVPKLQLRHDFTACSDDFKRHMNDWLHKRFGTYMPYYLIGSNTVLMSKKHAAMLRQSVKDASVANLFFIKDLTTDYAFREADRGGVT